MYYIRGVPVDRLTYGYCAVHMEVRHLLSGLEAKILTRYSCENFDQSDRSLWRFFTDLLGEHSVVCVPLGHATSSV